MVITIPFEAQLRHVVGAGQATISVLLQYPPISDG